MLSHPEGGDIALDCDLLTVRDGDLHAMVFTAHPGSYDAERLGELVAGQRRGHRRGGGIPHPSGRKNGSTPRPHVRPGTAIDRTEGLTSMDGKALQKAAADCAEGLPGTDLEYPFGPEWEVFKVRGKVFLLMAEVGGRPLVTVKADPSDAKALCEGNADITPGYHMNKRHWITLEGGGAIGRELVEELVTESYLLVVAKLPRAQRPVDPHTYGRLA